MANLLMKPGSILIILLIGAVLVGLVGWAENTFQNSEKESLEDQDQAIECSSVNVDFVDQRKEGENYTVYLQVNEPVEALMVQFEGSDNATRIIEDVETNSIVKASAPLDSLSKVKARVKGCDRIFG